jgi:ABC-2 type transport system ATP-binding protein
VRRAIGVVFQETVLDNEFSGMDNLRLHARLWRVPDAPARIAGLLDAVGLADRANDGVGTYSGGMKRRLEIARALLGRPRILVLDEPTLGLDPIVRNEMWQMIRTLRRSQHVTVLVSTHYLEEAQGVCDRVAIIDSGEIVAIDTPTRLIESLGTNILELVVDGDPTPVLGAVRGTTGLGEPMVVGSTVTAASARPAADVTDIASHLDLAGLGVTTTTVRPTSLNDVFLHLTAAPTSDRTLTPA